MYWFMFADIAPILTLDEEFGLRTIKSFITALTCTGILEELDAGSRASGAVFRDSV